MRRLRRKFQYRKVLARFDPIFVVAVAVFVGIYSLGLLAVARPDMKPPSEGVFAVVSISERNVGDYRVELSPEVRGSGNVITWYKDYPLPFKKGDKVQVSCELEELADGEGWERAWLAKGISATGNCGGWDLVGQAEGLEACRLKLEIFLVDLVEKYLKPPMSSLLLGMLAGNDAGMPNSFADDMRGVGLTHIIVVSGYNITVIFEGVRKCLKFVGRISGDLIAAALLSIFVWIVGGEPPVLRAAVMAWIQVAARTFGRKVTPMRSLFLSSIILFTIFPKWVWSVSFHLSFLATFAIFTTNIFTPKILDKLKGVGSFVKEYLFQTLGVFLFTLPYSAVMFGEISTISLVSNLLVLPVVEDIMVFGAAGILGGLVNERLGEVLFLLAWAPLWYLVKIVDYLAGISTVKTVSVNWMIAAGFYAGILLSVFLIKCYQGGSNDC